MKNVTGPYKGPLKSLTGHASLWLTHLPYYDHEKHETHSVTTSCLGERNQVFRTRTRQSDFIFPVPDIPLRFISLKLFFRHPLVGLIQFLHKHYDGFTI